MQATAYEPVYAYSRGGHPESLHHGAIAVVSATGELLAAYGDAHTATFLRSSAKPFQALPFVLAGGMQHYDLSPRELAVITASHSGTDEHAAVVASIQAKTGITEDQLLCGTHAPYHKPTALALDRSGSTASANRNNCSGKHTGMLAYAKMRGWPLESYIEPGHPLQQEILALFAELAGLSTEQLAVAIDGCSAPNWAAPLYNTALAYARLMADDGLPPAQAKACAEVRDAMIAHPDMVAGPGRFDTGLMQVMNGSVLSKGGAEGFEGIGLRPGALGAASPAIGIAIKISDGDARAQVCQSVSVETLRQLGALSDAQLEALAPFGPERVLTNHRGIEVGKGGPVFKLGDE
jgi:L-asparaginase II